MEQVDQQRAATQETRADDQAMLVGLREQLEAAHAEAFIAMCQWILANNCAAMTEAERDRTQARTMLRGTSASSLHRARTWWLIFSMRCII